MINFINEVGWLKEVKVKEVRGHDLFSCYVTYFVFATF